MTIRMTCAQRRLAIPAVSIAAMLLAGCSSGNIGESWQCPLAETGTCDSVSAVDPAVPAAAGRTVLKEPLWRVRAGEPADKSEEPACKAECGGGFDPFGWLVRLLGGGEGRGGPAARQAGTATAGTEPAGSPPASSKAGSSLAGPATAALPVEPEPAADGAGVDDPRDEDLRTDEVVARIWIAPFVDADGVYREASHVRVVLEPAGWRLK